MQLDFFKHAHLRSDADWMGLRDLIGAEGDLRAVESLIATLRESGVVSALIEVEYLDQDFTSDFSAFYSKVFRRYRKVCRRVHFFSEDISSSFRDGTAVGLSQGLQEFGSRGAYVGFVVIRPLKHARLGRAVLRAPRSPPNMYSDVLVRARYQANVLGASLTVEGSPYTQQDQRIGACAQASIWAAGRHFHTKHGGPRFSMADVAEAASKPADRVLALSLPAGSKFIGPDNMVRALKSMGREPLMFAANFDQGTQRHLWPAHLQPHRIINQYVDSGIPVIVGLFIPNQSVGHAVLAVGHTSRVLAAGATLPSAPTRAEFLEAFLVNDDQLGIQLRMPINAGSAVGQTPYNVLDNVAYVIVPLPKKVFMPAEVAEQLAWDLLAKYAANWPALKGRNRHKASYPTAHGDALAEAHARHKVVVRTYLTWGWKYKQRLLASSVAEAVKSAVISHALPKYVWVTEFGTFETFNHLKTEDCRIYGHSVADATSSDYPEARAIFHAPGVLHRWYHDPKHDQNPYVQADAIVLNDQPYPAKVRGKI